MSEATAVPEGSLPPQNLLAQMERLLAALDADLGRLGADLQADHQPERQQDPGQALAQDLEQDPDLVADHRRQQR